MPILGIGCDLLSLVRLRSLLSRRSPDRLAARILSNSEWAEWEKLTNDKGAGLDQERTERYLGTRFVGFSHPAFPAGMHMPAIPHARLTLGHSFLDRWAVKEAAYKALYPRYKIGWKDLCLLKVEGGVKPRLVWEGSFQRAIANQDGLVLHCSITHDADLIAAYVVAEEEKR